MSRQRAPILTAAVLLCVFGALPAVSAEPPDPSCRLYDTGRSGDFLDPREVIARKGWTAVPEGRLDHAFVGDAALANDKIAVVLHHGTYLVTCAALGAEAPWLASLTPRPSGSGEYSLKTIENSPGAVAVETAWEVADGKGGILRFRLTAGEPIVEIRPGRGVANLTLMSPGPQVVVPDFFGDDIVFKAGEAKAERTGLPAENALLGFQPAGLLMCVWEAPETRVDRCFPSVREALCCQVECREGKRLWVAAMGGPRLWERRPVDDDASPAAVLRSFKPPFPAKWRADFVGAGGVCDSITFEELPDAAPVPETWRGQVLIYPIDRSRATPLTTLLPVDVLRATLGVGPCQYILALEGLSSGDVPPTPAAVTEWVEKQFKRKRDARVAEEIRERLDAMVAHLAAARARIAEYAAFGRQVRAVCREAAKKEPAAEDVRALLAICDRLDRDLARGREAMAGPEVAAGLATETAALVGETGALAECEKRGERLRAIGQAQDATLARCRMAVRRMAAHCRSSESDIAKQVQPMAETMLRSRR